MSLSQFFVFFPSSCLSFWVGCSPVSLLSLIWAIYGLKRAKNGQNPEMTTFFKAYSCHACVNLLINPNLASTKGKMIQKNLSKVLLAQSRPKSGQNWQNWQYTGKIGNILTDLWYHTGQIFPSSIVRPPSPGRKSSLKSALSGLRLALSGPLRPKIDPPRPEISHHRPKISPLRPQISHPKSQISSFSPQIDPPKPQNWSSQASTQSSQASNKPSQASNWSSQASN